MSPSPQRVCDRPPKGWENSHIDLQESCEACEAQRAAERRGFGGVQAGPGWPGSGRRRFRSLPYHPWSLGRTGALCSLYIPPPTAHAAAPPAQCPSRRWLPAWPSRRAAPRVRPASVDTHALSSSCHPPRPATRCGPGRPLLYCSRADTGSLSFLPAQPPLHDARVPLRCAANCTSAASRSLSAAALRPAAAGSTASRRRPLSAWAEPADTRSRRPRCLTGMRRRCRPPVATLV